MRVGFSGKNIRSYLVQLIQICKRMRNFLSARRPRLSFSVDMPFWFLTSQKGPLPRFVFDFRWKEMGEHLRKLGFKNDPPQRVNQRQMRTWFIPYDNWRKRYMIEYHGSIAEKSENEPDD